MIRGLISIFSPSYARVLVYMLQSTEYEVGPYLKWWWRTNDFRSVAKRRTLDMTNRAKLLLYLVRLGMVLQILLGVCAVLYGASHDNVFLISVGGSIVVLYPIVWGQLIVVPLLIGQVLIAKPAERRLVAQSERIFKDHPATIIAVAGSYGKTTVKELLLTILSEGKNVAATPANKNVAVSHARFAYRLKDDEEVLIIEYGEGQPGDVARFAETTRPDIGVITGLAPAHLDKYKTLDAAAEDIFSLASAVGPENTFVNEESLPARPYIKREYSGYSADGVQGWKISDIQVKVDGLSFVMKKGKQTLKLKSQLVGRHLVGSLAMCAALASQLGMSEKQIEAGVAKTKPFEHRMQPRLLAGGWIIDDTYNGNLEGIRAGLALLRELKATRKIYVTPGLVDQGKENERVHREIGELIADAKPDRVVLMQNSVTHWIQAGLKHQDYTGEVVVEDNPLNFYTNLDQVIAVGDVVLMQNDWTDNYN